MSEATQDAIEILEVAMRMLNGVVLGPRPIETDSDLKGMIIGMATVRSGVHLLVKGIVTGDLVLEPGSSARIEGQVIGIVRNNGGRLDVDGVIGGLEETSAPIDGMRPRQVS